MTVYFIERQRLVLADIEKFSEYRINVELLDDQHAGQTVNVDELVAERAAYVHPYFLERIIRCGTVILIAVFWKNVQVAAAGVICITIDFDDP